MSTLRLVGPAVGIVPAELNAAVVAVVGAACEKKFWSSENGGGWYCAHEAESLTVEVEDLCDSDFGSDASERLRNFPMSGVADGRWFLRITDRK